MKAHSFEHSVLTYTDSIETYVRAPQKNETSNHFLTVWALLENVILIYSISIGDVLNTSNKVENEMKWKWWHTTFNIIPYTIHDTIGLRQVKSSAHRPHTHTHSYKTTFRWRTCFECTNQAISGWFLRAPHILHTAEQCYIRWVVKKTSNHLPNVWR